MFNWLIFFLLIYYQTCQLVFLLISHAKRVECSSYNFTTFYFWISYVRPTINEPGFLLHDEGVKDLLIYQTYLLLFWDHLAVQVHQTLVSGKDTGIKWNLFYIKQIFTSEIKEIVWNKSEFLNGCKWIFEQWILLYQLCKL